MLRVLRRDRGDRDVCNAQLESARARRGLHQTLVQGQDLDHEEGDWPHLPPHLRQSRCKGHLDLRTGVLERGTMLRRMLHVQMLLLASALKPPLEPLVRTHYSARSVVRSIRALDVPSTCHSPPHQRLLGHVQGYGP